MKFIIPDAVKFSDISDLLREFYDSGSTLSGSKRIDGDMAELPFDRWLDKVISGGVSDLPSQTFFCAREEDGRIIGTVDLRMQEDDPRRAEIGDIGFCVRPSERGRGYGAQILGDALFICRLAGMRSVTVTCAADNVASAAVIKKCGGVPDAKFYSEIFGEEICRYTIDISEDPAC